MNRIPFGRSPMDPRRTNTFLDSCAFDPKYHPEDQAAERIRSIRKEGKVSVLLAHSVQKEVDHPNTPPEVKAEAGDMIYTIETALTTDEIAREAKIHAALTGDGTPEKYAADAKHVFEAGKYSGYFVTTDNRILAKKAELEALSRAIILRPAEWLQIYDDTAESQL